MSDKRRGEKKPFTRFRSDRFIHEGGKWYFETREKTVEGPFGSRAEAEARLEDHIKIMRSGFFPSDSTLSIEPLS
jgi:hypothetical protein